MTKRMGHTASVKEKLQAQRLNWLHHTRIALLKNTIFNFQSENKLAEMIQYIMIYATLTRINKVKKATSK